VAFLITDGEELGLAGAAAVGRHLPRVHGIINLDGLDDEGDFHIIEQHGLPRRGLAPQLAAALLAAGARLGTHAERRALPVGVMVDHIPLAEAGFPAVTLMRGSARSLRRVHRPEDDAAHVSGVGAAAAVALVSGALAVLREAPEAG
ncbi:MAG: M28 family peptidase, partial [Gemmatimonadetes bacterium]|nr:M28 family peptidase [Gemmatimonadota bacterium]